MTLKTVDVNEYDASFPPLVEGDREEDKEEKPPIAQDFTDNPFSATEPVRIPSEQEKQAVWENMRKRFKVVHEYVKGGTELDGSKIKLVEDGSEMAANVLSGVLGVIFALAGEEYSLLAPSKDISYKMILPASRIWARHSKIAGEISPDYVDASACLAAVAEYTRTVMSGIRQIRELRAQGYVFYANPPEQQQASSNGYYTQPPESSGTGASATSPGYEPDARQNGAYVSATRPVDTGGYAPDHSQPRSNLGTTSTVVNANLTEEQRRNHEKLRELTNRDRQHRLRRAGYL